MDGQRLVVMVSSTGADLREHRKGVIEACLRQDVMPRVMEYLPATDDGGFAESMRLVDEADVYIGIFGHRYGYIPEGRTKSITHHEYERATERGIPRLIFIMHDDHPLKASDVEKGEGAAKLEQFKNQLMSDHSVNFFESADDLRGLVVNALADVKTKLATGAGASQTFRSRSHHRTSEIPRPPIPYIAHPYILLQTTKLVGRQNDLDALTSWATDTSSGAEARILTIVAIGGVGKSALTWEWFNEIAPVVLSDLAGRVWWSFYDIDGSFENFVTRTLAYVTGEDELRLREEPIHIREKKLLAILYQEKYLIVLDGLERILNAYARTDSSQREESDLDEKTSNHVVGAIGLPQPGPNAPGSRHPLRRTADPRIGQFLRRLAGSSASRTLISSRLYPADLQTPLGKPATGCAAIVLSGLSDQDAIDLWTEFGAKGSPEIMIPVFHSFENHPLIIQMLASEVASFHRKPGNFDAWWAANPDFNPFDLPIVQIQSHVLYFALRGLSDAERRTLSVIAGLRMPVSIETLSELLTSTSDRRLGAGGIAKPLSSLAELDSCLTKIEDRGLLGWDRRSNRYDLHSVVRGVVWSGLEPEGKKEIYRLLYEHFNEWSLRGSVVQANSLEEMTPSIEVYNSLIGLGEYDAALRVWGERLEEAMRYRFGANRQIVEMVERLFPDGVNAPPRLTRMSDQSAALNTLATAYMKIGNPDGAIPVISRKISINREQVKERGIASPSNRGAVRNLITGIEILSTAYLLSGRIKLAEYSARSGVDLARRLGSLFDELTSLSVLGDALIARGAVEESEVVLMRALSIGQVIGGPGVIGRRLASLAERELAIGNYAKAHRLASQAWELADYEKLEHDFINAARLQGSAAIHLAKQEDLAVEVERLNVALMRARNCSFVEDELNLLVALSALYNRLGEEEKARELLEDVWDAAELGPYPLILADAFSILARIELDAGNPAVAAAMATQAFKQAWCDGSPFAYEQGVARATLLLRELNVPIPAMPGVGQQRRDSGLEGPAAWSDVTRRLKGSTRSRSRGDHVIGRNDPCPCGSGKKFKNCHYKR